MIQDAFIDVDVLHQAMKEGWIHWPLGEERGRPWEVLLRGATRREPGTPTLLRMRPPLPHAGPLQQTVKKAGGQRLWAWTRC